VNNNGKTLIVVLTVIEVILALIVYNVLNSVTAAALWIKYLAVFGIVAAGLAADIAILAGNRASVVSDAKKLKDTDDYIRAFHAWLDEDTPFAEHIKIAVRQLESLKRKQAALRSVLDDTKDSPFFSVAQEVDSYILANSRRILNRVMIYDQNEPHKYNMHVTYLQEILGQNAHVLSDFENLILEVSQIGDDAAEASTPMLTELTNALRQVRTNDEAAQWEPSAQNGQEQTLQQ
jgi:cell division protein FtsB